MIGDAIKGVVEGVGATADKLFTSDDERMSRQNQAAEIAQNPEKWTHETNKIEASSTNWFVAGARPALFWICAISLGCFFIPQFVIGSYLWAKITIETSKFSAYPINPSELMTLTLNLLGMAGLRTWEKFKGVAR